jgi:hypothetical protein
LAAFWKPFPYLKIQFMKNHLIFLGILACVAACHNTENQRATIVHKDSAISKQTVPVVAVANDTLVRMQFAESDTGVIATAQVYMNGDNHVTCEVTLSKADSLHASLVPEQDTGNVRFSQIVLPNGKMDGPFGRELTYATPQAGTYRLHIFENMMAGDKWKGKFKVRVWVK